MTSPERKRFQTPPCLAMFLDVEATESGIDFDPLPEASAQRLAPRAELGIERTTRRARPTRKRIPSGHAIRRLLAVR
jgi:hypothetical protein